MQVWAHKQPQVINQLAKRDQTMKEHYDAKQRDESYIFERGDKVWLKRLRPGKNLPKALGPYEFVEYVGRNF